MAIRSMWQVWMQRDEEEATLYAKTAVRLCVTRVLDILHKQVQYTCEVGCKHIKTGLKTLQPKSELDFIFSRYFQAKL